jgi:DNA primase
VISHSVISRVLAATDMLDLANSYSPKPLKKVGAQWVGPCPFHSENTPSFYVSAGREWWHCKGACGKGGSAIDFVMAIERLSFPDAVRKLATRAGIEIENSTPADAAKESYARQIAAEAKWFWKRQGIEVDNPEIALKKYYEHRSANPGATVDEFRAEQELVKECLRIETAAAEMVGDLFPESFEELLDIICRPREEERSPILESDFV